MSELKAKIQYIYHSGFAIETENHLLIFDYYKEPASDKGNLLHTSLLSPENIRSKKNVFVFSSHSHGDHFNPIIFELEKFNAGIQYILSSDIKIDKMKSNYILLAEGDEKEIQDLSVKAYGSTDIGISFFVKVAGQTIFHAGDLNWWHWKEDPLEDQRLAESTFKAHIEKLKKEQKFDIAFFPVDPRLEEFYHLGGQYFAQALHPTLLVPMHFGDVLSITKEFAEKMKILNINTLEIQYPGQQIFPL